MCWTESLLAFYGASFDLDQFIPGNITKIVTNSNRKDYCAEPTGVGTDSFHVHCGCSGGCLTTAEWTVFWE